MTRAGRFTVTRPGGLSAASTMLFSMLFFGCVDKAPPPMWPAPPPPSVAEVIGAPAQTKAPPMAVGVVGAPLLSGEPSPLDSVAVDKANILDPDGPAGAAAAQAHAPRAPRPVQGHR